MKDLKTIAKILFLVLLFTLSSCKINRTKNNERVGKWVEFDTIDGKIYKTIGRFQNGLGKGTHRQYVNKKLVRKEKYSDDICKTTYYYENGKIMTEGNTKMILTDKEIHWFYSGDWKFYNEDGELLGIRTYENGNLINEIKIK